MSEVLPKGWVETTLGEIAEPSRERVSPADVPDMHYVGLEHIEPHTMTLLHHGLARETLSSAMRFRKGDILYGKMRPYLNKVWIAEFEGICSAEFIVLRQSHALNSQFLAMRLNAEDFVSFANEQISGERPRVDFGKISGFRILLPPYMEQARIATKLNSALSRLERAQVATRRAQERLLHYRAELLHAAFTGEFTRTRRTVQTKTNRTTHQPGKAILRSILAIRRTRWEIAERNRFRKKNRVLKDDHWKSRYQEPVQPDTTDLPILPKTWAWASLDMVAEIGSGISINHNRILKDPIELPYLRVANVLRGHFDLSNIKAVLIEKDWLDDCLLRVGDILFNEGGDRDKLGRGWVWEGQIRKCTHQNHVFRARPVDPSRLNPMLISHWGNTFGRQFFLKHATQTTNLASINRNVLGRLPIPIAPVEEQAHILREIDARLGAAERLTKVLEQQMNRARTIRQSLLHQAFAGSLVTQNPREEHASMLRERIRLAKVEEERRIKESPMTRKSVQKQRVPRRPLLDVLREQEGMTPEELFRVSGLDQAFRDNDFDQRFVDDFYAELRTLTSGKKPSVQETRNGDVVLLRTCK